MRKKLFVAIATIMLCACGANAYTIGGMYVRLVDCSWGQYGYKHGYMGTYKDSNDKFYQVFFGSNYCQY